MARNASRLATAVVGVSAVLLTTLSSPAIASTKNAVPQRTEGMRAQATSIPVRAAQLYSRMSTTERIGQLFMGGVPSTGATSAQLSTLRSYRIGSVILMGNTLNSRTRVASTTSRLRTSLTWKGARPFIAVDQEGGYVQRLTGSGFSSMPTALRQGQLPTITLRRDAATWGNQLHRAGINLDLAPVADVVPAARATSNQPIGRYYREFGHTPNVVSSHVIAFSRGMSSAHVSTSLKHFPGLGRATGNTDLTPGVTDPTTRHDPSIRPFRDAIAAGATFVMVSSATYPRIDAKNRACFSATIMKSMLRGDLHFGGVIVSDSLAGNPSFRHVSAASRAAKFISAGGTMVLLTSTSPVAQMAKAIRTLIGQYASFATLVHAAVIRVLEQKLRLGIAT